VDDDDNVDILYLRDLLFARANNLLRRFANCTVAGKVCLFKVYCIHFYSMALWKRYNVTIQKLHSAYVKCIKLFFNFNRRYHVAAVFVELGLPTLSTLVHNAKFRHSLHVSLSTNLLISYVFGRVGAVRCADTDC